MKRPEGWTNPNIPRTYDPTIKSYSYNVPMENLLHDAYEAGADAMLDWMLKWLNEPCTDHPLDIAISNPHDLNEPVKLKAVYTDHRYQCPECMKSIQEDEWSNKVTLIH